MAWKLSYDEFHHNHITKESISKSANEVMKKFEILDLFANNQQKI